MLFRRKKVNLCTKGVQFEQKKAHKKRMSHICETSLILWSHLGLNQGPPDYESGATNQLSYRTNLELRLQSYEIYLKLQRKM